MYFNEADHAVGCAIAIQKNLAQTAQTLPPEEVLEHRIGIHLGDVFLTDDDVMGNGVNIAARLQTQAEPGGICFSQTVYDVVKNTLSIKATYLGPRELKNISEAFPVYQILLGERPQKAKTFFSKPLPSRQDYRNRQVLLDKVQNYWIKGVLETSLHDRVSLELGLESREDMLDHPWSLVWQQEEISHSLPSGTKAIDKFDELGAGRTLLILGDPGSGKTTTLLELARELIDRAKYDVALAMPVVFNLSSWAEKKQPLEKWLETELNTKYQVGKEAAKEWVKDQKLLLLLDGLDEVSADSRNACVEAINQFCQEHGQTEMVVCSRIKDYEALSHKLQLQGAICLQPLTLEQVQNYFTQAGEELAAIGHLVETDATLQELAKSPLMLSIMTLAYRGVAVEELTKITNLEERRKHLFDTYIQRMFDRRFGKKLYDDGKTKFWLSYLAKQLVKESQTVFFIEQMQPSWLPNNRNVFNYHFLVSFCFIFSLYIWLFHDTLFYSYSSYIRNFHQLCSAVLIAILSSLWIATTWRLLNQLLQKRFFSALGGFLFSFINGLICFPVVAMIFFIGNLTSLQKETFDEYILGLISVFTDFILSIFSLFTYLAIVVLSILFWTILKSSITPSGNLQWSSVKAKQKLLDGMLLGLGVGLVFGGMYGTAEAADFFSIYISQYTIFWEFIILIPVAFITGWPFILLFEVIGGIMGYVIGGLSGTAIEKTTKPNQGIWQTLRNALIIGTTATLVFGIIAVFLKWPVWVLILIGCIVGMSTGGITVLKHFSLRVVLSSTKLIPWNYANFLNYATSCILLQKVGGGYIFIHRLLLEHFANSNYIDPKTSRTI